VNSSPKLLRGIAWNHSRALPPLVAASQRFEELHPDVEIRWDKRTLHEFGHQSISALARMYDIIVIDHPWAGEAFACDLVHDLKSLVADNVLHALSSTCVGRAFESYEYDGKLLALPIDIAAPAPSWRLDLLDDAGVVPPTTWTELVDLARRGLAVMPGFHADVFLNFLMLCRALDRHAGTSSSHLATVEAGTEALERLRELACHMSPEIYVWNPISLAEAMTTRADIPYCAFAYSYNNYSREGFAARRLTYGNLVTLEASVPLHSVLGGTGLAITKNCQDVDVASEFVVFTSSPQIQSTLYLYAGGQPANGAAWSNSSCDAIVSGFFSNSRYTHENAFVRPRYPGYVALQEQAGLMIQAYLKEGGNTQSLWNSLEVMYRQSRANEVSLL
jgi:multiple sugar transport system substrate-binding protein